jgi:hypothetical protein
VYYELGNLMIFVIATERSLDATSVDMLLRLYGEDPQGWFDSAGAVWTKQAGRPAHVAE